jgi:hypothetical protein
MGMNAQLQQVQNNEIMEKVIRKIVESKNAAVYFVTDDNADLEGIGEYLGDITVSRQGITTEMELWAIQDKDGLAFAAIGNPIVEPEDVIQALGLNVLDLSNVIADLYLVLPKALTVSENESAFIKAMFNAFEKLKRRI